MNKVIRRRPTRADESPTVFTESRELGDILRAVEADQASTAEVGAPTAPRAQDANTKGS